MRDFVKIDNKIGVIIANDKCGGVFRGHADVWFGDFNADGTPLVQQLCVKNTWEVYPRPIGKLKASQ